MVETLTKVSRASRQYLQETGKDATPEQIAEMTAAGDMSYLKPAVLAMSGMPVLELNDREYADVIVGKKIRAKEGAEPDIKYAAFHNGELTAVLYLAEENGKRLMRIERMLKGNV